MEKLWPRIEKNKKRTSWHFQRTLPGSEFIEWESKKVPSLFNLCTFEHLLLFIVHDWTIFMSCIIYGVHWRINNNISIIAFVSKDFCTSPVVAYQTNILHTYRPTKNALFCRPFRKLSKSKVPLVVSEWVIPAIVGSRRNKVEKYLEFLLAVWTNILEQKSTWEKSLKK